MNWKKAVRMALLALAAGVAVGSFSAAQTPAGQSADAGAPTITKRIGTIKAINGMAVTLAPASGPEVGVTVQPNARILRLAPGDKDLKNATPLQAQDLHVGDTIRVRGSGSADGNSISALEVLVITQAAVTAVSDQIRQDWQKRGMGGRVDSVDAAAGTVTIFIPSLTAKKTVVVHTTKTTVVYRYAPDSAKPEDAKPSTLQQIQPGDQLRARGERNADGSDLTAEEIYVGVFPQFAATIKSVDANAGTVSVLDLSSKKTVELKITADSQLHKIPVEMAQGFALRLKGMMPAGMPGAAPGSPTGSKPAAAANGQSGAAAGGTPGGSWGGGAAGGGSRPGGSPDLQRMLSRMPSSTLADLNLQKGDAVIILATEGTATSPRTALTLLSGVEPILQAVPSASQAMMLTPWSLGGGAPGGDSQ
ncbi:MAG TPA: DUF5666 domain-containing protein [Candidatus Dormibacteraeota bacterium]|nr:DUF5666 domain-containing protein [Candidatus Dormibacteraeota bacterium]